LWSLLQLAHIWCHWPSLSPPPMSWTNTKKKRKNSFKIKPLLALSSQQSGKKYSENTELQTHHPQNAIAWNA
jgi:hypothetical protein